MIGGDGSDTTAATKSFLDTHSDPFMANLYLIGELEDPGAQFLTDFEAPLSWPLYGIFRPGVTKRDTITAKIGLEVDDFSFEWSPPITPFTTDMATANPYQLARLHFYDAKPFKMFRTIGPTKGDANTFGACVLFGGRIKKSTPARAKITFVIESSASVFNAMIPPNVIEVTNPVAAYKGATPVLADGETVVARFTAAGGSNSTVVLGTATAPTAGKIYGRDKFRFGYLVFTSGPLKGKWSAIGGNADLNAGAGVHYNQFSLYNALPWDPQPGDQFYVSTAYPVDGTASPFLHVPAPEQSI